jgi:hypothetical protein
MGRDLQTLTDAIDQLAKASDAAEKACGGFDPVTLTSLNDISTRQAAITALRGTQSDMVTYLQNYAAHGQDAMAKDNFDPTAEATAIASARQAAHVDQLITVWQLKEKLSDDHLDRLDFLSKNWGHWSVQDGKLLFQDEATLSAYHVFVQNIHADIKALSDAQSQISH